LGFLQAASKIIDTTSADLWITGRGVSCFEFPVTMERRFVEIAHSVPGVAETSRICTSQVELRKQDGNQQLVVLIGADARVGDRFPMPRISENGAVQYESVLVDESNAALLNLTHYPQEVELNEQRAAIVGKTSGFGSFLGSPYVFTSYADGARYIRLRQEQTMFILIRVAPGASIEGVRAALQKRLENVDVWTRDDFSRKARLYWITQTGAGGAILMAALLGFLVGLAIVSQSIYATTMENIEEFATLRAIGASNGFIIRTIVLQSLICGIAGYILGVAVTAPVIKAAAASISWVTMPWWLPAFVFLPAVLMCVLASVLSIRTALTVEPAKVFRA
jgi:putative ABC transport system permease protein